MLQEESCKRLSYLMHKAFSKAHFGEFSQRIDINIDAIARDQKEAEMGPQQKLNLEMGRQERNGYQDRIKMMDQAPKIESSGPLGDNFPEFNVERQRQQQQNDNNLDYQRVATPSRGVSFAQVEVDTFGSPQQKTQLGDDDDYFGIGKDDFSVIQGQNSFAQEIRQLNGGGAITQQQSAAVDFIIQQTTKILNKQTQQSQNLSTLQRGIVKRLQEFAQRQSQAYKQRNVGGAATQASSLTPQKSRNNFQSLATFQQSKSMAGSQLISQKSQKMGRSMMSQGLATQIEKTEIMEKDEVKALQDTVDIKYICYGDIIMLNYTKKIYRADMMKEKDNGEDGWDGESLDEAQQVMMDDHERKQRVKLQKLIERPQHIYKGMVYSDGILDKSLHVIPKDSEHNTINAKCQFRKCLFRVEIFDNCTYHMQHRAQDTKLNALKVQREDILETNDFKKVAEIDAKIAQEEEHLKKLKHEMKLESASNQLVQDDYSGQKIQYGDKILLRHVFTDLFLCIEPHQITDQEGMVQVILGELSNKTILNFIPAQDIKDIASELVIHQKGLSKFNLQVGGQINMKDSFFLLNREMKANYYVTVDERDAAKPDGVTNTLAFNAGLCPTHLRAKLFLSSVDNLQEIAAKAQQSEQLYQKVDQEVIFSGDTIRLKNQETQCFLQTQTRMAGKRSMVNPFPVFLQKQIQQIKDLQEDYKTENQEDEGLFDSDRDLIQLEHQDEQQSLLNIGMDTDTRWQSITNSCWEIQHVKSLHGSPVLLNSLYRFKHISSERYLSLDSDGRVNLVLREGSPIQHADTLFILRSINQEQEIDDDDVIQGHELYNGDKFYIETAYSTFLQVYQQIKDEAETLFQYEDKIKNDFYTQLKSNSMVNVVAGSKQMTCEEGEPKMVFQIELVPKTESLMAFKSLGFTTAVKNFFDYLNEWAVGEPPINIRTVDNLCFSQDLAIAQEQELKAKVDFLQQNFEDVREILNQAIKKSKKQFKTMQQELQEHFMIELLAYTLELIYYKTMPEEFREKPFKPDRMRANLGCERDLTSEHHMGHQIARERLDELNSDILGVIYLMIRDNEQNSEHLTQFVDILKVQLLRGDKEQVVKIICHMYKMSNYIFNDRASILLSQNGLNQKLPYNLTVQNQIDKWLNLLETITYRNPQEQNIESQIIYLKIITKMIRNKNFYEPVLHQQVQVLNQIIYNQPKTPLWFGYNKQANKLKRPFVYFPRLQGEESDKFLQLNPHLNQCVSQGLTLDGQKTFDIIIDLNELTQVSKLHIDDIQPYFLFIKAVVGLYEQLCQGRNMHSIQSMREKLGISNNLILTICESEKKQQLILHQILKDAFLKLAKTLFYNYLPFNEWASQAYPENKNMCYMWDSLRDAQPQRTLYSWEKFKLGQNRGSGYGIMEQECIETNKKLREILLEFFTEPTHYISEFFYGSEGKTYKAEQINPILQRVINRFETVYSVFKSDCADAYFSQKIIEQITQVLAGFSSQGLILSLSELWIYKVIRTARNIERCEYKLSKLVHLNLLVLQEICETRLSEQLLHFLKIFREFSEEFDISYVGYNSELLEPKFKRLFQMQQFTTVVEVKSLSKMLHMMNPKLPIFEDSQREEKFFEKQRESIKELAVRSQQAKKQIKVKVKRIDLEDIQFEELPTGDGQNLNSPSGYSSRPNQKQSLPAASNQINVEMTKVASSQSKLLSQNNDTVADQYEDVEDDRDSPRFEEGLCYTPYTAPPESERITALWRSQQPLEEFLLFYSFIAEANDDIPQTAMSIVTQNMNQREKLIKLLQQVQLIVSEEEVSLYNKLKFYKERIESLINNMISSEFTYLIYKVGSKARIAENLRDLSKVTRRITNMLKQAHGLQLSRLQAMLRQINLDYLLITKFMKNMYYDQPMHEMTFQTILELLFYYCLNNVVNQLQMKKHISYLIYVTEHMDLNSGPLLGQLVSAERLNSFGQKFTQFIVNKVVEQNLQRYQFYQLLTFLVQNTQSLKIQVISQLISNPVFRHKLYMNKKNVSVKIERIKELVRKISILQQAGQKNILTRSLLDNSIIKDMEVLKLHTSVIGLMSMCSVENTYGIKQIRRIVDFDCLLDTILAWAVPFKFKKSYLRLLYTGYMQEIDDVRMFDMNFPKFLLLMRHVVLYDLNHYYMYYAGLAVKNVEEEEKDEQVDLERIQMREQVKEDLQRLSDSEFEKENEHKNYKQKLEEKEFMLNLSPLNQNRVIQLLDPTNSSEYWDYFCSYDVELRSNDGLIYFIRDFFRAVAPMIDEWSDELIAISKQMRINMLHIIDKLDRLKESYAENLVDLDNVQFALDEAILAIPNLSNGKKMDGDKELSEAEDSEEEEKNFANTQERILRICRDAIIGSGQTIRALFKIESKASDILVNPYFIKKKLKDICGLEVSFKDISWFIEVTMKQMLKKLQLKGVLGQEIGMPGYIRARYKTLIMQEGINVQNADLNNTMFNFKELETMIRSALTKAGVKTSLIEREDALQNDQMLQMEGASLQIGVQSDLTHFVKIFNEFMFQYKESDQVHDLATKILQRFNKVFLDAIRQLGACQDKETASELYKMYEYRLLKTQLQRLTTYLPLKPVIEEQIQNKQCMLRLCISMLKVMEPDRVEVQIRQIAKQRRTILQNLMASVGVLKLALLSVDQNETIETVDLCIELIDLLGMGNNLFIIEQLKEYLSLQVFGFSYFKMIEQKIIHATDEIINQGKLGSQDSPPVDQEGKIFNDEKENLKREKTVKDVLINNFEEPFIQRNNNLQQPIFYPMVFSLEEQDIFVKKSQAEVLIPLLKMIQRHIDSECAFELILVQQAENNRKNVNLVKAIAYSFINIIRSLKGLIFTQFSIIEVLQQLLLTLIKVIESDHGKDIKMQFAQWDLLLGQINWVLELDFNYFLVDKVESRYKLRLLQMVTRFLLRLLTHSDLQVQRNISNEIVKFLNKQNLRNKLLDIFKSKIGGTPHREKIFKTRAFCYHVKSQFQRQKSLCQRNEHCFFEHLLPLDLISIGIAEDIFMVLYIFNTTLPKHKLDEVKFDYQVTGFFFNQNMKEMLPKLQFEAFNQISDQANRLQKTISETHKIKTLTGEELKGMESSEVNQILEQLYIHYATQKYLDSVKRNRESDVVVRSEQHSVGLDKFINQGIDQKPRLMLKPITRTGITQDPFAMKENKKNIFYFEELENLEWDEIFLDLLNENSSAKTGGIKSILKMRCCSKPSQDTSRFKRFIFLICCFSWCHRFRKNSYMTSKEKAKRLIAMRQHLHSKNDLERITQYFSKREQQIQKSRKFAGPFFGNYTRQILQNQVYIYDQFKYEYAFQFLLENFTKVQIQLADGRLVTETFVIPHYVRFLTEGTAEKIKKYTRWEILENLAVMRVEMQYLQAMERFSPFILWLVSKYTWSLQLSYTLTFWQNAILLMTYTREKLLTPFTKEMITGRVDLLQNEGDTWIDYGLEIMSMSNMQALFFSLWSYQILYFKVTEFNMNSDKQTNWALALCKRKEKIKSSATKGSLHDMFLDSKTMKTDPTLNFNDKKFSYRLVQDDEEQDSSQSILSRLSEIPSMQSAPGQSSSKTNLLFTVLSKASTFLRAPLHDKFMLQLLIFQTVSFFAIWLDWWNLTIMLLHLFMRVPFLNALWNVFKQSFGNIYRLVFLGFIMLYALSYVRLLAAVQFKTEEIDGTQTSRNLHSAAQTLGDESFFEEKQVEASTLLEAMQQVIGVQFHRNEDNTFTILNTQIPGSLIQEVAQTVMVAFFFLFVGIFIGTILGGQIGRNDSKLEDIKCQVCDVTRANYEAKKLTQQDWDNHINRDHNIYAYIYYMLLCCEGNAVETRKMTRTQKYVRNKLRQEDLSFMPVYNEREDEVKKSK